MQSQLSDRERVTAVYAATRGDFHVFALAGVLAGVAIVACELKLRALNAANR